VHDVDAHDDGQSANNLAWRQGFSQEWNGK